MSKRAQSPTPSPPTVASAAPAGDLVEPGAAARAGAAGHPPSEPVREEDANERIGRRIRALRNERDWSLARMSEATGVARSTISKVETGQMSPTVGLLQRLARGLGVNLTQLLDDVEPRPPSGRRAITRFGQGEFFEHDGRVHEVLCGELSEKKFLPFRTVIPAQSEEGVKRWYHHDGEEFIYVLEGTILLCSKVYAPVELRTGDCGYVDAQLDHVVINPSDHPAHVLWVISN